jgi:hypothetical protein
MANSVVRPPLMVSELLPVPALMPRTLKPLATIPSEEMVMESSPPPASLVEVLMMG